MKWLFFLLILANGGLYLWATNATPQAGVDLPEADPGVNLDSMELVSEQAIMVGARTDCLRIGPFATRETLDNGWRLLVDHGYGLTRPTTTAREERIYQVVAGPFRSDIVRDNARIKLEDQDLRATSLRQGDEKLLLLQPFAQEPMAVAYAASLEWLQLPVNVRLQVRTLGPLYWLEVPDVITEQRREELAELNWADALAELTPVICPKSG